MIESTHNFRNQQPNVIGIIRPTASPKLQSLGNLVELNRSDINNADQDVIEKFFQNTLHSFAEERSFLKNCTVVPVFFVDPALSMGYPYFSALRLEGDDISRNTVDSFKAALSFLCAELRSQASLFSVEGPDNVLSQEDEEFLRNAAWLFCTKHADKRINKPFCVHIGFEDPEGTLFEGLLAPAINDESTNEILEGDAQPDGFSVSENKLYLFLENGGQRSAKKTVVFSQHKDHLDLTAHAYIARTNLHYRIRCVEAPGSKKAVCTVISLELVADKDEAEYSLV